MKSEMNRREYMERFLRQEKGIKPAVGFWHHFVGFADHHMALTDETVLPKVILGQKKFIDNYHPDFVKVMCDGFFSHPSMIEHRINTVEDLDKIQPAPDDHPWFAKQVEYVRTIREYAGDDCMLFYSIFSPMNYIRLRFAEVENDNDRFPRLFLQDPKKMLKAINIIRDDVMKLVDRLMADGAADGFFYSVQSVQDEKADDQFHTRYVEPSDTAVAQYIHDKGGKIILHICGWGDFTNPVYRYADYPADIINWATNAEKLSLAEGKKLFHNRPVLGGFDNNPGTLLYTGSREEIKQAIFDILDETGETGVAIGADCTLNENTIEPWRIAFAQEAVKEYYWEKLDE